MSITTMIFGCLFIGSLIGIKLVDTYEKEFDAIDELNEKNTKDNGGE